MGLGGRKSYQEEIPPTDIFSNNKNGPIWLAVPDKPTTYGLNQPGPF